MSLRTQIAGEICCSEQHSQSRAVPQNPPRGEKKSSAATMQNPAFTGFE
jgi:hypothetical protein